MNLAFKSKSRQSKVNFSFKLNKAQKYGHSIKLRLPNLFLASYFLPDVTLMRRSYTALLIKLNCCCIATDEYSFFGEEATTGKICTVLKV
jgi:hypothetical protein